MDRALRENHYTPKELREWWEEQQAVQAAQTAKKRQAERAENDVEREEEWRRERERERRAVTEKVSLVVFELQANM